MKGNMGKMAAPARVVGIIEVRVGSSRLPGKVAAPILGKPMLEHLIDRLHGSRTLTRLVIATTEQPADDPLEGLAGRLGVDCYRGDEDDVLARVRGAAEVFGADVVVKLSGDNPLYHPEFVDPIVQFFLAATFDFVSNTAMGFSENWKEERTWPIGTGVSVFRRELFAAFEEGDLTAADCEHVIKYIIDRPHLFKLGGFPARGVFAGHARPELRFAVDTAEDLEFIRAIFAGLYPADPRFTLAEAIAYVDAHPEVRALNADVGQRALSGTVSLRTLQQ